MATAPPTIHPRHEALRRVGAITAVLGLALLILSLFVAPASAKPSYEFQGNCVGSGAAGTCVLDEPEGKNPAVHGLVTYALIGRALSFAVATPSPITEMQICMQTSEPFALGANVCAGSHGYHVAYTRTGSVYTVDLRNAGFADTSVLYWTLHVVSAGRTLQVRGSCVSPPATTTTTDPSTTTSSTSTTIAGTTTTAPPTTTTTAPATTSSALSTTSSSNETTSSVGGSTVVATTTTTQVVRVGGEAFGRTGGARWWMVLTGSALLLVGLTLLASTRVLGPF